MGLLDGIKSYLPEGEDEQTQSEQAAELTRQRKGNQFDDLPEEIEEMSLEDVADEFARMEQQQRLEFVQSGYISQEKWKDLMKMIENNPKQRDFWGLDGSQINIKDGVEVCACHEEVTQTLTVTKENQETMGQTQGTTETSKTEAGGKVSGSGGAGIPGVGNVKTTSEASIKKGRTQGETQQEMAQVTGTESVTKSFHSCRIETTNSTLSRRAFLKTGDVFIRRSYNKTESENNLIDDWEIDADRTAEQEQSQKGIGKLREERDALEEQIEDLDEQLEMYDSRIEQNETFISQCEEAIEESEGAIDVDDLDKRDRLLEKYEEFQEKKEETLAKKKQFRTQKSNLQGRIEDHDDYEATQGEADTAESATQDTDESATEDQAAESEDEKESKETTDSAGAHDGAGDGEDTGSEATAETNTPNQTNDPPESDGGPPTDDGGDDRGGEPETDTEERSTTVEPDATPAQASADSSRDETDQPGPDDNESDAQSEDIDTEPTVSDGDISDRLTGTRPSNSDGTGTTNSKDNDTRKGPGGPSP